MVAGQLSTTHSTANPTTCSDLATPAPNRAALLNRSDQSSVGSPGSHSTDLHRPPRLLLVGHEGANTKQKKAKKYFHRKVKYKTTDN